MTAHELIEKLAGVFNAREVGPRRARQIAGTGAKWRRMNAEPWPTWELAHYRWEKVEHTGDHVYSIPTGETINVQWACERCYPYAKEKNNAGLEAGNCPHEEAGSDPACYPSDGERNQPGGEAPPARGAA